jgi:hypothetical protein
MATISDATVNGSVDRWLMASAQSGGQDGESRSSGNLNVLISSRLERLAANFNSATGAVNDALTSMEAGSRRRVDPSDVGSSNRRYSPAAEMGEVDYGSNVDTIGGPSDTIDQVMNLLRSMGQDAVRAQANQLPNPASA